MKVFIVWNEAKTEGFVTIDKQLAYEVRKSADTNCYNAKGERSDVAVAFIERWFEDNCAMQEIEI